MASALTSSAAQAARSSMSASGSGSALTTPTLSTLDVTPTSSPLPDALSTEAAYGSVDSVLSHMGSSAGHARRISDSRPRVPRLETDAAALGLGRAPPLITAQSASTDGHSASSHASRNGAFFGTNGSSPASGGGAHGRHASGSSTLAGASSAAAGLGHSSSSLSISSMDSAADGVGLARQSSTARSGSSSSRFTSGYGSSLRTPSSGVELHSASSIRSRRNWDEFEGKPITPLPSPSVYARERNGSLGPFDASFAQQHREDALLPSEGRARIASAQVVPEEGTAAAAPETPSSKTLAFFGAPRSPLPAPSSRSTSATFPPPAPAPAPSKAAEHAEASSSGGWLSRTNAALSASAAQAQVSSSPLESSFPSGAGAAQQLHQPTRLPTLPAGSTSSGLPPSSSGNGWLEGSFSSSSAAPAASPSPSTSAFFFGSNGSSGAGAGAGASEERLSSLPSAIMNGGAHKGSPLRPSASAGSGAAQAETLMEDVPAARRRGSTSRHTHGPSENASGSSFLPRESSPSLPSSAPAASTAAAAAARPAASAPTRGTQLGSAPDEEVDEDLEEGRVGVYKIERTLGVGAFSKVVLARRLVPSASTSSSATANGAKGTNGLHRMIQSTMAHCSPKTSAAKEEEKVKKEGEEMVALKMMEREPCALNERMRVSWVREVEVLKHISHPNIVRFIDSFSTLRHHTLVLETVPGGELFELLAQHQAELASREWLLRRLFGELAHAVGWMHSINLVHRDIKLENIILTCDLFATPPRPSTLPSVPLLKVTDFGLSRFVDPAAPLLETRCGSEEYAAPELIIGKRYDGRRTDVWALGVVLYALLTGSLPFLEDSSSAGSTAAREGEAGRDARERKAHLLRIAKGDLRWPAASNEEATDLPSPAFPPSNRLITPQAKYLAARLLRRDATKRAQAWEVWDDAWMLQGSFPLGEASAAGDAFAVPLDPRSEAGTAWLAENARVIGGLADVAAAD